ncbi:MAG: hypothetical protein MUD03_06310 [Pirellula sp.]|nr:hypothetical protein [Pirellula sp.]
MRYTVWRERLDVYSLARDAIVGELLMSNRMSLRGLLASIGGIAVLLMFLRLAIIQDNGLLLRAILCMIAVPLFTFVLFALFYTLTLPFGVLAQITRESMAPAESPFAKDRLPDAPLPTTDYTK